MSKIVSSSRHRLKLAPAVSVLSGLIRISASTISVLILSRSWEPDDFGAWSFIISLSALIGSLDIGVSGYIASLSCGESMQRFLVEKVRPLVIILIILSVALGFATVSFSNIAEAISSDNVSVHAVYSAKYITSILVMARLAYLVNMAILASLGLYNSALLVSTAWSASILVTNFASVRFSASYVQNLCLQAWVCIAFAILAFLPVVRVAKIAGINLFYGINKSDFTRAVLISRKCLLIFPGSLSSSIFVNLDKIIVGSKIGFEALAIYSVVSMISAQINNISAMALQPMVHIVESFPQVFGSEIRKYYQINMFIPLTLSFGIILFAPSLAQFSMPDSVSMTGSREVVLSLSLMAFIYGLYSQNAFGHYYFLATGRAKLVSAFTFAASSSTILIMLFVSEWLGLKEFILCNIAYATTVMLTVFAYQELSQSRLLMPIGQLLFVIAYVVVAALVIYARMHP